MIRSALILSVAVCALSACAPGMATDVRHVEEKIAANGEYWQRTSASSAQWMQGPKAQQVLNRDIARCVTELGELERLGQIKTAFPAEKSDTATTNDPAHQNLMGWDTPERDGALLNEHSQYMDFESCMMAKGWERVRYVPYGVAKHGAENYVVNHAYLGSRDKYETYPSPTQQPDDYDQLNN